MDIRQALLKAADHIEANPGEFDFGRTDPLAGPGCGTPGCALGWTGYFLGKESCAWWRGTALYQALGISKGNHRGSEGDNTFYRRMDAIYRDGWQANATDCAKALRLYAAKYHPEETEQYPEIKAELDRIIEKSGTGIAA